MPIRLAAPRARRVCRCSNARESDEPSAHSATFRCLRDQTLATTRRDSSLGSRIWSNSCSNIDYLWLALRSNLASFRKADRWQLGPDFRVSLVAGSRFSHCSRLRSEEHTSELQSRGHLVCRLLLE